MKSIIRNDIIESINKNRLVGNITVEDATKLISLTQTLYNYLYSNYDEMEDVDEIMDQSLILPVEIEIEKRVKEEVEKRVDEEVEKRVDEEVEKRVDEEVEKRVDEEVEKRVDEEVEKRVEAETKKMQEEINKQLGNVLSQLKEIEEENSRLKKIVEKYKQ